ncbi:MAG: hypothetical protein JEY91_14830, partial [Spirochaetaceae bacterium]|nr:hypothetical protein [Spirochaetaceae bacterium]
MDKRVIIISAAVLVIILAISAVFILGGKGEEGKPSRRDNTISLAREYFEHNEFQQAMDLLNGLLIEDSSDNEARGLLNEVIEEKKKYESQRALKEQLELQEQQDNLKESLDSLGDSLQNQSGGESQSAEAMNAILAREQERAKEEKLQKEVDSLLREARNALNDKDFNSAESLVNQALNLNPDSGSARALKA